MSLYKPNDGQVWNPFLKLPRNKPCPCGSGKKFKKCHLDQIPRTIGKELLDPKSHVKVTDK